MDLRSLAPVVLLLAFSSTTVLAQSAAPGVVCESMNGTSCEQCLTNVTCLWCIKTKACVTYPVRTILPPHSLCPLYDARWGLCWMNFQNLIITLAVLGGVIIIALLVCMFCCCKCENVGLNFQNLIITLAVLGGVIIIALLVCMFCCCKCENVGPRGCHTNFTRKQFVVKILCFCLHRRAEMKQRHDDIRKKYGLSGPNPYSRFG
ncbi:PTTG1 interacting protein a [Hippocampus comes]|uniref:PTTG1 interacting protein a n=1 Tax=Hippocampus comes TaxID=109280 RepID=UPI00094F3308|nr:PREDICTED: pituitary tumor-transforming gene 1 protein-interacting protein-like [Hippocampus comes]